jgi:hypothetical protein
MDLGLLLYREEYYKPDTEDKGIMEIKVAKLAWSISIHKSQVWRVSSRHHACFDVPLHHAVTESHLYRAYPC